MKCIVIDDDPFIQTQIRSFCNNSGLLTCVGVFDNPNEAITYIKKNEISLLFLDIEMPGMSGLEFLAEVDEAEDLLIIIISGDRKYALQTFQFDVFDYLLKPIEYNRFIKSINKVIQKAIERKKLKNDESIFFRVNDQFIRIKFNEIYFYQIIDNNLDITVKAKVYHINNSLEIHQILSKKEFCQINENTYVNLQKQFSILENKLIFPDIEYMCDELVVEKSFEENLKDKFQNL